MQFKLTTTTISLLLAAAGVQAHPSGALEERQEPDVVHYEIWTGGDCAGRLLAEGDWVDTNADTPGPSPCIDVSTPPELGQSQIGIKVETNTSDKNLTIWNVDNCPSSGAIGNIVQFGARQTGCRVLPRGAGTGPIAQSVQFGSRL